MPDHKVTEEFNSEKALSGLKEEIGLYGGLQWTMWEILEYLDMKI